MSQLEEKKISVDDRLKAYANGYRAGLADAIQAITHADVLWAPTRAIEALKAKVDDGKANGEADLIVARCRETPPITPVADRWEAADVIDELRKKVARLREALKPFAKARWGNDEDGWLLAKGIQYVEVANARAALGIE